MSAAITTHDVFLESVDTQDARRFRAVCSCGWTSALEPTNRCMGRGRRHVAARRRIAGRA